MGDDACGACTVMCIGFKNKEVKHEWTSKALHGEEVPSYPMYVLPLERALKLTRLRTHEELAEDLVEWQPGMDTIFFSHTWLGHVEPDPSGTKMELVRHILQHAQAGTLDIRPLWIAGLDFGVAPLRVTAETTRRLRFVWLDWWSIPQVDRSTQAAAISSLPVYVARSTAFCALVPPAIHENGEVRDLHGWGGRGWCKMELFCNALASVGNRPLIVAQSASDIVTYPATGTFTNNVFHAGCAVGQGRFTVEADRAKLGPVMERVLAARKRTAFADGDIFTYRLLHAKASALLAGTGADVAAEGTLDEWMAAMRFETVRDCERGDPDGWTPLIFAVVANRVDLAAALLDRGAKLRQRTRRVDKWQCLMRGFTPQHAAATMCDSPEMMQLLLARGASPRQRAMGTTSFLFSAADGRVGNMGVLLERDPGLAKIPNIIGARACGHTAMNGNVAALEWLLANLGDAEAERQARRSDGKRGGEPSLAFTAVMYDGNAEYLRALIRLGIDVTGKVDGKISFAEKYVMFPALSLVSPDTGMVFRYAQGTPLHAASFNGMLGCVKVLLEGRADPTSQKHPKKMAPLHLAALKAHSAVARCLIDAGASLTALDGRGQTPAQVAEARGAPPALVAVLKGEAARV